MFVSVSLSAPHTHLVDLFRSMVDLFRSKPYRLGRVEEAGFRLLPLVCVLVCRSCRPYIAPEQGARFGQYNHKADMWSLGVILFEMLAPRSGNKRSKGVHEQYPRTT